LGGGVSVYPVTALDYVPGVWVRESHVVCNAHLFVLQINAAALETASVEKCTAFLSAAWHREEAFDRLGIQNVTDFDSY
jgi:hypothetical protein